MRLQNRDKDPETGSFHLSHRSPHHDYKIIRRNMKNNHKGQRNHATVAKMLIKQVACSMAELPESTAAQLVA